MPNSYRLRIINAAAIIAALFAAIAMPVSILRHGYLPDDDVFYHAANAVSGKQWNQIIVVRNDVELDPQIGWHTFLKAVREYASLNEVGLVKFCIVSLFALFCAAPLFLVRRPEAWLLALIAMSLCHDGDFYLFDRLMRGRPYIITTAVILVIGLVWPKLQDKKNASRVAGLLVLPIAIATYLHGSWYLFALPIACLFLSQQRQAGAMLLWTTLLGIAMGAVFTGHPVIFLGQTFRHIYRVFGYTSLYRVLTPELRAGVINPLTLVTLFFMLSWRRFRQSRNPPISQDPVFVLMAVSMLLGCVVRRFWFDLGRPALLIWLCLEFQEYLESKLGAESYKRVFLAMFLAVALHTYVAADVENRWSNNHPAMPLTPADPELAQWMPEDGGIFYCDTMTLFDTTFFNFPRGNWRYILGTEPGLMPDEDLAIYRNIMATSRSVYSFIPWANKLRPQDRLVVADASDKIRQYIPNLEWHDTHRSVWIGRLPRNR